MKICNLFFMVMLCVSSTIVYAQTNAAVWLEPVSDDQYRKATTESGNRYTEANKVLTTREQAIVAIASYTGKGDLEHLKPALAGALEAGMTINEINEVLIHAYAYCGFPRSLRAIQTFTQVVDERKADGINDSVGREASAIQGNGNRYERGRDVLAEISGVPVDAQHSIRPPAMHMVAESRAHVGWNIPNTRLQRSR